MKKIYINGRFLNKDVVGGVKRFAIFVARELLRNEPDRYAVVCPKDADETLLGMDAEIHKTGRLSGLKWEMFELPLFMMTHRGRLFSPCNIAPWIFSDYIVIHDVVIDKKSIGLELNKWENKCFNRMNTIMRHAARHARLVLTVSEFSKSRISAVYGVPEDKIKVIYSCWDHFAGTEADSSVRDENEGDYFLSVSSLMSNKNFAYMEKLAELLPNEKFYVIGKPLDYAAENRYPNMRYLGELSDARMAYYYKHCKAYISPSLYEGFGVTPLEALSFGCRRLYLSDIPVFHEIYDGVANFFDPRDPQSFVSTYGSGKDAPDAACEEMLASYTWANTAKAVREALSSDRK